MSVRCESHLRPIFRLQWLTFNMPYNKPTLKHWNIVENFVRASATTRTRAHFEASKINFHRTYRSFCSWIFGINGDTRLSWRHREIFFHDCWIDDEFEEIENSPLQRSLKTYCTIFFFLSFIDLLFYFVLSICWTLNIGRKRTTIFFRH